MERSESSRSRLEWLFEFSDRILLAGVILLLILPPVWFGAVEPWPEKISVVAALGLGLVWVWQRTLGAGIYRRRLETHTRTLFHRKAVAPLLVLAALIICYGLLTLVPLPASWVDAVSPASLAFRRLAEQAVPSRPGGGGSSPLSLAPLETVDALMKLAAVLLFFFVCLDGFLDWRKTRAAALAFILVAFAVSLAGILQALTGSRTLLWIRPVGAGDPFGPFVNRNHFASWAGMGAMLSMGYLFSMGHRRRDFRRQAAEDGARNLPEVLATDHNLGAKRVLVAFFTAVTAGAVFLSLSRGGMSGLMMGMLTVGLLLRTRKRLGRGWRVTGVLFLALAVALWIGAYAVIDRMESLLSVQSQLSGKIRSDLAGDALGIFRRFVWTGTGPGTFGAVYPAWQTGNFNFRFTYAHNDYLQAMSEWGAPAFGLFMAGAAVWWWRFLRNWSRRRNGEVLYLSAGAAGGVALMMAHALVDFNLHITANALALAFTAALGMKATGAVPGPEEAVKPVD